MELRLSYECVHAEAFSAPATAAAANSCYRSEQRAGLEALVLLALISAHWPKRQIGVIRCLGRIGGTC